MIQLFDDIIKKWTNDACSVGRKSDIEFAIQGAVNESNSKIREAIANYISSEGCGCCSDWRLHEQHQIELAKLLDALYDDESGFDFMRYRTQENNSIFCNCGTSPNELDVNGRCEKCGNKLNPDIA